MSQQQDACNYFVLPNPNLNGERSITLISITPGYKKQDWLSNVTKKTKHFKGFMTF